MIRLVPWAFAFCIGISISPAAQAQVGAPVAGWGSFEIPQFHTSLEYPAAIFVPAGASEKGVGERFQTRDRSAILSVYGQSNRTGETPVSYLQNNLQISTSAIGYKRITRTFFAISMERGGTVYYSRCNFSGGVPGAVHCFDLTYPEREKWAWDAIVTRMSLSLRPLS